MARIRQVGKSTCLYRSGWDIWFGGLSLLWVPHESGDWLTEVTWGRNKLENKGSEDSPHQDEGRAEQGSARGGKDVWEGTLQKGWWGAAQGIGL